MGARFQFMQVIHAFTLVAALVLAGCTAPGPPPSFAPATQSETPPAPTSTAPAKHAALKWVANKAGGEFELRVSATALSTSGAITHPFPVTSIAVQNKPVTNLGPSSYPQCDSRMQGLRVVLYENGVEGAVWQWPGRHCEGDAAPFGIVLNSRTNAVIQNSATYTP